MLALVSCLLPLPLSLRWHLDIWEGIWWVFTTPREESPSLLGVIGMHQEVTTDLKTTTLIHWGHLAWSEPSNTSAWLSLTPTMLATECGVTTLSLIQATPLSGRGGQMVPWKPYWLLSHHLQNMGIGSSTGKQSHRISFCLWCIAKLLWSYPQVGTGEQDKSELSTAPNLAISLLFVLTIILIFVTQLLSKP